ncbi:DUF3973 domain-containing protein [Paenibacillus alba]|nr:DUF3973 domain-containing protein [Paenibacillus alba]
MVIYCLNCNTLAPSTHVTAIFKTGFYKRETHLGICKDCRPATFSKT